MTNEKSSFYFLLEWDKTFELLNMEQSGRLIKAMITYEKTGEEDDFSDDKILQFAWESNIKPKMDKLSEHYQEKVNKRSAAGKVSAEKRKQKSVEQKATNSTSVESVEQNEQMLNLSTDIDLDLGLDLDLENYNNSKELFVTPSSDETAKPEKYQPIVDAWNALPVTHINGIKGNKRIEMLRARIKEYSLEDVLKAIENIKSSPFLLGRNKKNWQITFDWFIRPNNFPKVLEGNYLEVKNGANIGDDKKDDGFQQLSEWERQHTI